MRLNIVVNTTDTKTRLKFLQPLIGLYLTVVTKNKEVFEGVNIISADQDEVVLLLMLEKPAVTKVVRVHDISRVDIH